MDRELTTRLAREAGFEVLSDGRVLSLSQDEEITKRLEHYAQLVAAECANIAERHEWWVESGPNDTPEDQHRKVAEKIRATFLHKDHR
jgi:hypothetical protein